MDILEIRDINGPVPYNKNWFKSEKTYIQRMKKQKYIFKEIQMYYPTFIQFYHRYITVKHVTVWPAHVSRGNCHKNKKKEQLSKYVNFTE